MIDGEFNGPAFPSAQGCIPELKKIRFE